MVALVAAAAVAAATHSYWALVVQNLTQAATLLVVILDRRPVATRSPRRGVPMRSLLRFGWKLVGTQLIGYASNNTDTLHRSPVRRRDPSGSTTGDSSSS